jgi:hypothetical protein
MPVSKRKVAECESLEGRCLLASAGAPPPHAAAQVSAGAGASTSQSPAWSKLEHDFHEMARDIREMQRRSHVTNREYNAVAADLAQWKPATSDAAHDNASPADIRYAADDLEFQEEYAVLGADFKRKTWAQVETSITSDLAVLGLTETPSQTQQLMTDLEWVAYSADVTEHEARQYLHAVLAVMNDVATVPNAPQSMEPIYYFWSQLGGFVAQHPHPNHSGSIVISFGPGSRSSVT